jgi:hypothetical protein
MPSKLPIIKANTTQSNIDKMKIIAETNKRSLAKELELIIEEHIKKYEKEHGEIQIEEKSNKENAIIKGLKIVSGVAVGEAAADIVIKKTKKE